MIFLLLITLIACQTVPTKNNQSQTQTTVTSSQDNSSNITNDYFSFNFKLNVGDNKHSFVAFMKATPIMYNETYNSKLKISIYELNNNSSPYQIIDDYTNGTLFKDYKIDDVNFDGYLDFYYADFRGNVNSFYHFWLWNPKTETYVKSEELNNISLPAFKQNTKIVSGYNRSSAVSNTRTFYKYINEVLTCVRILDMGYPDENNLQLLTVQDYVDGKLVKVFTEKPVLPNDNYEGKAYDEFFKWLDLNYHGTKMKN